MRRLPSITCVVKNAEARKCDLVYGIDGRFLAIFGPRLGFLLRAAGLYWIGQETRQNGLKNGQKRKTARASSKSACDPYLPK
jgi:hypothetical protein